MHWYKISQQEEFDFYKHLEQSPKSKIRNIADRCTEWISFLQNKFPSAKFQTTASQEDWLKKYGPVISFFCFYDDIKNNLKEFESLQIAKEPFEGVVIKLYGFIIKNGFDLVKDENGEERYRLYQVDIYNDEKIEFHKSDVPPEYPSVLSSLHNDGDYLKDLIRVNVIRPIDSEVAFEDIKDHPNVSFVFDLAKRNNWDPATFIKAFEKQVTSVYGKKITYLTYMAASEWAWGNLESKESMEERLLRGMDEIQAGIWDYDLSMNPQKEGRGKSITLEQILKAFSQYGDFKVYVQYNSGGTQPYNASEIANFQKDLGDKAFSFTNQQGGIRNMST